MLFRAAYRAGASTYGSICRRPGSVRTMAAAGTPPAPKYWVLRYDYVADIVERRGPYREAHLAGAQAKLDAGKLVCAGATGSPPDGALFLFKDVSKEEIEEFVKADPYVQNALVTKHAISPYAVVVGSP